MNHRRVDDELKLFHALFRAAHLEFVHVLRGKTGPLKLSTEQALEILSLFLGVAPSSSPTQIHYYELLKYTMQAADASLSTCYQC